MMFQSNERSPTSRDPGLVGPTSRQQVTKPDEEVHVCLSPPSQSTGSSAWHFAQPWSVDQNWGTLGDERHVRYQRLTRPAQAFHRGHGMATPGLISSSTSPFHVCARWKILPQVVRTVPGAKYSNVPGPLPPDSAFKTPRIYVPAVAPLGGWDKLVVDTAQPARGDLSSTLPHDHQDKSSVDTSPSSRADQLLCSPRCVSGRNRARSRDQPDAGPVRASVAKPAAERRGPRRQTLPHEAWIASSERQQLEELPLLTTLINRMTSSTGPQELHAQEQPASWPNVCRPTRA